MEREHRASRTNSAALELGMLGSLAILWGSPFALTKVGLETITPVTFVAARVALAAIVLWVAVMFLMGRSFGCGRGLARQLLVHACLNCVVPYTLIAWGQQTVSSSLAAILNSVAPIFVWLIAWLWTRHEPIAPGRLFGVVAGLGGVVTVIGFGALGELGRELAGQLAILLATMSLAIAVVYGRRFAASPPEVTAAGMLSWSAILLVPLAFVVERPLDLSPSAESLMALIASGAFATAVGFVLYFRLIRTLGPMGTSSVGYLKTAVGVLIGCAVFGEAFTTPLAAGLVGIVIGVIAINRRTVLPAAATIALAR